MLACKAPEAPGARQFTDRRPRADREVTPGCPGTRTGHTGRGAAHRLTGDATHARRATHHRDGRPADRAGLSVLRPADHPPAGPAEASRRRQVVPAVPAGPDASAGGAGARGWGPPAPGGRLIECGACASGRVVPRDVLGDVDHVVATPAGTVARVSPMPLAAPVTGQAASSVRRSRRAASWWASGVRHGDERTKGCSSWQHRSNGAQRRRT